MALGRALVAENKAPKSHVNVLIDSCGIQIRLLGTVAVCVVS